jgi:hypothetical protein
MLLRIGMLLSLIVSMFLSSSCAALSQPPTCYFFNDPAQPTAFDRKVSARLTDELARYRLTNKSLPQPGIVYSVAVVGRTARIQIAKWDPSLPGGEMTNMPQANDFRYAQVWQGVYDEMYSTKGECVRMLLNIVGENQTIEQHCWSSTGPNCSE